MSDSSFESRREQLFRLLPRLYQILDAEQVPVDQKGPLREFLSVIGEQVNLLEDDLARWYDNWFIETCEDWVVPYIGDLVGYESAAKGLDTRADPESILNRNIVFPRRDVTDTVRLRRRKGTLALLEELSRRIVGWPARAVEYRRFTAGSASLNHLQPKRGRTVDLRDDRSLALLDTAFDRLSRTVDIRRITSRRTPGRYNLSAVALFVYRRKIDSVTLAPAFCRAIDDRQFVLSTMGLDLPLHVHARPESDPTTIARVENLPGLLTRQLLAVPRYRKGKRRRQSRRPIGANPRYYGPNKSLYLVVRRHKKWMPVLARNIVVCNLADWLPPNELNAAKAHNLVAVDPELGRVVFSPREPAPTQVLSIRYIGRPAYIGGGEYERQISTEQPYLHIGRFGDVKSLRAGIVKWQKDAAKPKNSVLEIIDSSEYSADAFLAGTDLRVPAGHTLEIRAGNGFTPTLQIPDVLDSSREQLHIHGEASSRLILDGLTLARGRLRISGDFAEVLIRDCTFVPGRTQLVFHIADGAVRIDRCILGSLTVESVERKMPDGGYLILDPIQLSIQDSIIDPVGEHCPKEKVNWSVIGGEEQPAYVRLSVYRSTVLGTTHVLAIDLIENSIFTKRLDVENCLDGCVRFSFVPTDSHSPPQFHCQPSMLQDPRPLAAGGDTEEEFDLNFEELRVVPQFLSTSYAHPDYARLIDDCAPTIVQGADDEAEMGAYHNEFFAQRAIHLRERLQEFVPAGYDAEIIFAT